MSRAPKLTVQSTRMAWRLLRAMSHFYPTIGTLSCLGATLGAVGCSARYQLADLPIGGTVSGIGGAGGAVAGAGPIGGTGAAGFSAGAAGMAGIIGGTAGVAGAAGMASAGTGADAALC